MSCVLEVLQNKKLPMEVISRLHHFRGCCASLFYATQCSHLRYCVTSCFFIFFFLSNWRGMGQKIGFYMTCRIWLASNAKPGISVTPDVTFPDFTQIMLGYSSSPEINKKTQLVSILSIFVLVSNWRCKSKRPSRPNHKFYNFLNDFDQNSYHCTKGMNIFDLHGYGGC